MAKERITGSGKTPAQLKEKLDDLEQRHSLKEVKEMARQRGLPTSGNKRKLLTDIFVHHAEHWVAPMTGREKTFYAVQWWLADESDVRVIDQIETLDQALKEARKLNKAGEGYHDFIIYSYRARLVIEPFLHEGTMYPYEHWEKISYERQWDIDGRVTDRQGGEL
jgi:hypothetical protein